MELHHNFWALSRGRCFCDTDNGQQSVITMFFVPREVLKEISLQVSFSLTLSPKMIYPSMHFLLWGGIYLLQGLLELVANAPFIIWVIIFFFSSVVLLGGMILYPMRSDTVPYEKEFRNSIQSIKCRASMIKLDELKNMRKGREQ